MGGREGAKGQQGASGAKRAGATCKGAFRLAQAKHRPTRPSPSELNTVAALWVVPYNTTDIYVVYGLWGSHG